MVPTPMPGRAVASRLMDRLRRRQRRSVGQIRGEHQNQGRDDAESQKRVQRRHNGA